MKINIKNRVRQIPLGKDQALRPVYEAVANAFDAIRERSPDKLAGTVLVRILRGAAPQQGVLTDGGKAQLPIVGFEIVDDGIGFTDENYDSFEDVYSDKKLESGGKGTGRLLYLKAFEYAEVSSVFLDGRGRGSNRKFRFDLDGGIGNVSNGTLGKSKSHISGTTVRLVGLLSDYRCPANGETIARHLIEHNLEELLIADKIRFQLEDEDGPTIDLRTMFVNEFRTDKKMVPLTINGYKFQVRHFLVKAGGCISSHKISYCARKRVASDENLSRYIGDLKDPLQQDGESVFYLGTVTGAVLDAFVNETRSGFELPEEANLAGEPTQAQIAEGVVNKVKAYLQTHLDALAVRKRAMVERVINEVAPELRTVVARHGELLEKLAVDSSKQEVLAVVSGQRYADREEYHTLQADLMKVAEMGEKIKGQKQRLIEKFTAETRAESAITLADSVIHRRAVLDVLNQLLGANDNDKFHKEEAVHGIIFPLRKTSDDMPPDLSNLWVIDERLAFHHYLASDKRIDQLDPIKSESGREPDIIVFHHAFAAAEDPECPQAITIIEFKRPGRDDYSFDENPYVQIKRYVELILDSKVKDRTGRIFAVPPETRFYGYIVADLTTKLTGLLKRNGFEYGTEMGSMFTSEPNLKLSIHAIDYKQLVKDATRRNRAFFHALGLH